MSAVCANNLTFRFEFPMLALESLEILVFAVILLFQYPD